MTERSPDLLGLKRQYSLALILALYVSPSWQFTHYVSDPNSCEIVGDTDIYGIGVRISYYLAFWSGIIAVLFNHKNAVRDCRKGLNIISSAVFITVVRNTVQGSFALFEWYIVFPMVIFIPIFSLVTFNAKEIVKEIVSMSVWFFLNSTYSLLQPWIWWIKLHQGSRPQCNPQVLIYAWFDLYNPKYVTFGKVISIFVCITGAIILLSSLALILAAGFNGDEIEKYINSVLHQMRAESPHSHHQQDEKSSGKNVGMALLSSFPGITVIVFTELVLKRNRVDLSGAPLTSTSQLLPLLVGIFTFVSTIWSIVTDKEE